MTPLAITIITVLSLSLFLALVWLDHYRRKYLGGLEDMTDATKEYSLLQQECNSFKSLNENLTVRLADRLKAARDLDAALAKERAEKKLAWENRDTAMDNASRLLEKIKAQSDDIKAAREFGAKQSQRIDQLITANAELLTVNDDQLKVITAQSARIATLEKKSLPKVRARRVTAAGVVCGRE